MKKQVKNTLIIIGIILSIIFIDTLQAKMYDNSPILKVKKYYDGGTVNYIDDGLFVRHYKPIDGTEYTIFNWEPQLY